MFKNLTFILAIAIVVLATPFIAIPSFWKNPFFIMFGSIIAIVSYREKHAKRRTGTVKKVKKQITETVDLREGIEEVSELESNETSIV